MTVAIAGSSGCLGDDGHTDTQTNEMPERTLELTAVDSPPQQQFFDRFDVDIVDKTVKGDSPPAIDLILEYTVQEPKYFEAGFFTLGAITMKPSHSDTPGLLLLSTDNVTSEAGCWKLDNANTLSGTGESPVLKLSPGKSFTERSYVFTDHRMRGCFEPGPYRFESTIPLENQALTVGFELTVRDTK